MIRETWSPTLEHAIVGPQLLKLAEAQSKKIRTEYSPDLSPFMDENVYGRAAVFADLRQVMEFEKRNESENSPAEKEKKRVSDIFESYYVDAANTQKWFGENFELKPTAKFDDYFRQVDTVGTFRENDSRYGHIGFSSDLTYGYDASLQKMEDILNDIANNRMSKIRYFHSEAMGYTGQLSNIPKTIIGLDKEHLGEFIRLWTHDKTNPQTEQFRNIMLFQLVRQLRLFTTYADQKHGESIIRNSYAQALRHTENVWKRTGLKESDIPYDTITDHVTRL